MKRRNAKKDAAVTCEEAARILEIPEMGVGQLLFEGRLKSAEGIGFCVSQRSVEELKECDLSRYK